MGRSSTWRIVNAVQDTDRRSSHFDAGFRAALQHSSRLHLALKTVRSVTLGSGAGVSANDVMPAHSGAHSVRKSRRHIDPADRRSDRQYRRTRCGTTADSLSPALHTRSLSSPPRLLLGRYSRHPLRRPVSVTGPRSAEREAALEREVTFLTGVSLAFKGCMIHISSSPEACACNAPWSSWMSWSSHTKIQILHRRRMSAT